MKQDSNFVLESASWPAFLADEAGCLRRANAAAVSVFGPVLESDSSLLASIWAPENEVSAEVFLVRLLRTQTSTISLHLRTKGGSITTFDANVCAVAGAGQKLVLFQFHRVEASTAKPAPPPPAPPAAAPSPAAEASVQAQKQKLECALQLARTVSLDFNNALTIILGHVSLILSRMAPDHPWRNALLEVEKSAERAAEIAHDLAAFSRQDKDHRTPQADNLNEVVRRTVEGFQASNNPPVLWGVDLEPNLHCAPFDEAKVQQAVAKILENALQASPEGGMIHVQTSNHDFAEPTIDGNVQLAAGTYVRLAITDTGPGIPDEIKPRIFEPFFTTKAGHRGLGLAWVYGIVTNHGGCVVIHNPPGGGTSVHLYLPAQKRAVRPAAARPSGLRGSQTVLLVDDEDLLLAMGQTILSAFGYRVLIANSGARALEVLDAGATKVDLVVTDMVMPNMSGRELIEQIRRRDPSMRILTTSGYVRPAPNDSEVYLQKPFTSQELVRKVRQALSKAD